MCYRREAIVKLWAGRLSGALCLLLVPASGCRSLRVMSDVGLRIHVGRPFLIAASSKAMGWGYYSHPVLWELPPRHLILLFNAAGDLPGSPGGQLFSMDGGLTWSELEQGIKRSRDLWGCIRLQDGWSLVYSREISKRSATSTVFRLPARYVSPEGVWGEPFYAYIDFSIPLPGGEVAPYGICAGEQTILVPFYGPMPGEKKYTVLLLESNDRGAHFLVRSVIARPEDAPWGNHGPAEPTLVALPNGRLLCLMRTGSYASYSEHGGSAKMLIAESSDGGRIWKKRFFPRPGARPRLVLMSNGVLVCAFGRPGNNLMFSTDYGRTWIREIRLTALDARSTGYVGLEEVAPGKLLAVYDLYNSSPRRFWLWEPPRERNALFGVFVDVVKPGDV